MTLRKLFTVAGLIAAATVGLAACDDDDDDGILIELFQATLTGAQVVPPVVTNATGTARVQLVTGGVTFSVRVDNITNVTAAFLNGPAGPGVNAPALLNLNANTTVTTGVLASGTATSTLDPTISIDSLKSLIRTGNTYIIVTTTQNPDGEIRGQLTRL